MGKTKTAFVSGEPEAKHSKNKSHKQVGSSHFAKSARDDKGISASSEEAKTENAKPETEKQTKKYSKKEIAPRQRGKKYREALAFIDKNKSYSVDEAIDLIKKTSYTSFDGTVEMHILVRKEGFSTNTSLTYSSGKERKVEIASDATVKKLEGGKIDFDILLATADMMPKLVPFARLLGPKGLMPNPKNGTIIKTKSDAEKFGGNQLTLKTEKKAPLIHTSVGKVSQDKKELSENIKTVLAALGKNQVLKAHIAPTMGPSVKLEIA